MDLTRARPRYVTFDCYGTLTSFALNDAVRPLVADRVAPQDVDLFLKDYRAYRIDEILGELKLSGRSTRCAEPRPDGPQEVPRCCT